MGHCAASNPKEEHAYPSKTIIGFLDKYQMKAFISYSMPDHQIWSAYTDLWDNSICQSAFQAPNLLQYFSENSTGNIGIYQCYKDNQLVGAAFFHKKKAVYTFLSDLKTDHNYFILHKDCSDKYLS